MSIIVGIGSIRAEGRRSTYLVSFTNEYWNTIIARFEAEGEAQAFAASLCEGLGLVAYRGFR